MKWLFPLLLISLVTGCAPEDRKEFDDSILEGEWNWDSSEVHEIWFKDWVYFDSELNYYKYTYWNDSYLMESGHVQNGKVFVDENIKYSVDTISSERIKLIENDGTTYLYRKADYSWSEDESYEQELEKWRQKDKLKKEIHGKWKLVKSKYPIEMMNSPEVLTEFTLEFKPNNSAIFYKNHNPDSSIEYGYKTRTDGIVLERGCVVGNDSPIYELNDSSMSILLDSRYWQDTLILQRIPE